MVTVPAQPIRGKQGNEEEHYRRNRSAQCPGMRRCSHRQEISTKQHGKEYYFVALLQERGFSFANLALVLSIFIGRDVTKVRAWS